MNQLSMLLSSRHIVISTKASDGLAPDSSRTMRVIVMLQVWNW